MKKVYSAVAVFLFFVLAQNVLSQTFYRDLTLGSSGSDVKLLQEILNKNSKTQLAQSGYGSLGNETEFFGSLTHDAVIRFQELNRAKILIPLNLSEGTGYVGEMTRHVLNDISGADPKSEQKENERVFNKNETPINIVTPNRKNASAQEIFSSQDIVNMNKKNKNIILDIVRSEATKQGVPNSKLDLIEGVVAESIENTKPEEFDDIFNMFPEGKNINSLEDLIQKTTEIQEFVNNVNEVRSDNTIKNQKFGYLVDFFYTVKNNLYVIPKANAQISPLLNFGGRIVGFLPCTCPPGVLVVAVFGLNGGLFDYIIGSQVFSYYNTPLLGVQTAGKFVPALKICWFFVGLACIPPPSIGTITPITGTSLIPLPL